ncbi:RNA polymerase-binding protein RbpA [Actinobacteria bacterium YIM 96077]|uniref:RNA polymerase-binding protein RbpA n=1 Tax=Phytoactinopolyspora halophila TaxID=1981511 RepID=A0A329QYI5_9ACTN|nr:RNA polymerase-binding protein RbpA [Phytoactinopolyspora halophila]AYY13291.1 RNA polymerase-binding protein RbpA [Actinobacteria bacterium YIM 96077]RAW17474.1 RNA polymerase-binding protein RbpA [Phytoactinopolyspora halophila]
MSERSTLRGSRLGARSYEDERGVEFAERQVIPYACPAGHEFEVTFSTEADVPTLWDCPRCGTEALQQSGEKPDDKQLKPARTHWDMLLERRSMEDLEALLNERLELLRAGLLPGAAHLAQNNRERKKSA